MDKKFERVVVGGTFDMFHRGHQTLLEKGFEVGNYVIIGLCSDVFLQKLRKPHGITPYVQRLEELKSFLEKKNFLERAKIVPLDDSYGITLTEKSIDAIVVSAETEPRAHEINEKRKTLKMSPLSIVVVKMVFSEDHYPISSTRIWFEEIDREGNLL